MIQPIGLAVLEALGQGAALRRHGAPITRLLGRLAPEGRRVLDLRYSAWRTGATGLAVQRATLFGVLLPAAEEAGARLVSSVSIQGAETRSDGVLLGGAESHGPFDLALDCLGAGSPLCPRPGRDLAYGALWGLLEMPEAGVAPDLLEQRYVAARRMTGVLPVGTRPEDPNPKVTFFWSLRGADHEAWRQMPLPDWKATVLADWPAMAPLLDQIGAHDDLVFARYRHRTLSHPVSGRVAHLGDSYHAASPQLGQGANMALLDAAALAAAMAGVAHGHEIDAALARYARIRRLHVALYTAASWAFTPMYQSDSRVLPVLRDWLLAPLSQVWPVPGILARLVAGELCWPRRGMGGLLG